MNRISLVNADGEVAEYIEDWKAERPFKSDRFRALCKKYRLKVEEIKCSNDEMYFPEDRTYGQGRIDVVCERV